MYNESIKKILKVGYSEARRLWRRGFELDDVQRMRHKYFRMGLKTKSRRKKNKYRKREMLLVYAIVAVKW